MWAQFPSVLKTLTSKSRTLLCLLLSTYKRHFTHMFKICLHAESRTSRSSGSSVIAIKLKDNTIFTLQIQPYLKLYIFKLPITIHHLRNINCQYFCFHLTSLCVCYVNHQKGFGSSGVWSYVTEQVFPDVPWKHSGFIFKNWGVWGYLNCTMLSSQVGYGQYPVH
jgi:hypothetical protein